MGGRESRFLRDRQERKRSSSSKPNKNSSVHGAGEIPHTPDPNRSKRIYDDVYKVSAASPLQVDQNDDMTWPSDTTTSYNRGDGSIPRQYISADGERLAVDCTPHHSPHANAIPSPNSKKRVLPQQSPIGIYKQTEGQVRRGQIVNSEYECTEICPYLFVGGAKVAQSLNILEERGITHIINCAASVIPNYFESSPNICYLSLKMLDGRDDDISWFITDVVQFIYKAMLNGHKMLLHCEKGISRSCSLAIAYHMWSTASTWKQSFNYVKSRRLISNPNTAFTCNLIEIDELLNGDGRYLNIIFRVARHLTTDNTPVLKLCRHQDSRQILTPSTSVLDPRGIFVIRCCQQKASLVFIWRGLYAPPEAYPVAEKLAEKILGIFTKTDAIITTVTDGEETPEFFEYVTPNEHFDPERHRSYSDLWTPEQRPSALPNLAGRTSGDTQGVRMLKDHSRSQLPASSAMNTHRLPPIAGSAPQTPQQADSIFMPIDAESSITSIKEDSLSISESTRDDVHGRELSSSRGSTIYESVGPKEEVFATLEHQSSITMGIAMMGDSSQRNIQPLTPSRPSSNRPRSPLSSRRNQITTASPSPSDLTSLNPLSPTRQAVKLPSLESAKYPSLENDIEAMQSASLLSQRPELSSMHLSSLQDSEMMMSSSTVTLSSLETSSQTGNDIGAGYEQAHHPRPLSGTIKGRLPGLVGHRRLRKPVLYQALWNDARDVYEWQALGVYDDDDLIDRSALLLVCPYAPHFLWIGSQFVIPSLSEAHHSPEVIFSQWACNDVDMSQLLRDKKVAYLLPLSRLEICVER
jgi:protein-tyrosine phosphatase